MNQNQTDTPIQPVEQPILCNPYEKPNAHPDRALRQSRRRL